MHRISKDKNQLCLGKRPGDKVPRLRGSKVGGGDFARRAIAAPKRKMVAIPFQPASEVHIEKTCLLVGPWKIRVLTEKFVHPTRSGPWRTHNKKRRESRTIHGQPQKRRGYDTRR